MQLGMRRDYSTKVSEHELYNLDPDTQFEARHITQPLDKLTRAPKSH